MVQVASEIQKGDHYPHVPSSYRRVSAFALNFYMQILFRINDSGISPPEVLSILLKSVDYLMIMTYDHKSQQ